MTEMEGGPRVFLQKPKKGRRPLPETSSSVSKIDGTSGTRSVSTAASEPPPPPIKQPFWYRFRAAITTLLVVNAVVIGYTVFRTRSEPSQTDNEKDEKEIAEERLIEKAQVQEEHREEAAAEKDKEKPIREDVVKKKGDDEHTQSISLGPSKAPRELKVPEMSKEKISSDEQQELFQWLLAEKRKMKPSSKAERAQIDAEKALLKEFLRGKRALDV